MKLPERVKTDQPSLGRYDVSGPGQVFVAQTNANMAWAKAFGDLSSAVSDIVGAQDKSANLMMLSRLTFEDKRKNAEFSAYLTNTPVLDLADPNLPQEIRDYATEYLKRVTPKGESVPNRLDTHRIMDEFMMGFVEESQTRSLGMLKGTGLEYRYLDSMSDQITSITTQVMEAKVKQRQLSLKAMGDMTFREAIMSGDFDLVTEVANNNMQSGAWTPDIYAEEMMGAFRAITESQLRMEIETAADDSTLDEVQSRVTSNPFLMPDVRVDLTTKIRSARFDNDKLREREQNDNYRAARLMLAEGSLTNDWVTDQLAERKITSAHEEALRKALQAPPTLVSDPVTVDQFLSDISMLAIPLPDDTSTTVTERADQLRERIISARIGATEFGVNTPKTISGSDFADLMAKVDQSVDRALGEESILYKQAEDFVRTTTGYRDAFVNMFGDSPNKRAYNEFQTQLREYMNFRRPGDPSPLQWAQQNGHRFEPENFEGDLVREFRSAFPQYSPMIESPIITQDEATAILMKAYEDRENGYISADQLSRVEYSLRYKYAADSAAPLPAATDANEGVRPR